MDYTSVFTGIAIVLYGVFEYRRRERKYRLALEYLRRNIEPPAEAGEIVPRWRIVTLSLTAFITVAAAGILMFKGITNRYGAPLIVIACIFFFLAVPLLFMIVRDRRMPRGRLWRGR